MDNRISGEQKAASAVKSTQIGLDRGKKWCTARVCFGTFFYDIDCEISKFADDTKIASQVYNLNHIRSMQRTLGK